MRRFKWFFLMTFVFYSGCTKLGYAPEIVTLQKLSHTQEITDKYVDHQEELFKEMKVEIANGQFDQYKNSTQIEKKFGEPAFVKPLESEDDNKEMWIYRRPVNYSDSDKVYLYFDGKGQLLSYKLERFEK
ncbi:MAG: hypothetical protein KBD53_05975 [Candidatus Omnitrophica bacterium]|nr:hypothetical protein [Candidatus Omnitrophota bacterium]